MNSSRAHCPSLVAVVVLVMAGAAAAQTTRPAQSAWADTVESFAKALVENDTAALASLLAENAVIRSFDSKADDALRLLGRTAKGVRIGAHPYIQPAKAMAADLAADFKTSPVVPEDIKKTMVPEDDAEMSRANATAVQWMADTLSAKEGAPVGVIVLWCPRPKLPGGSAEAPAEMEAVWILFKAEERAGAQFRITTIVFGEPLVK